MWGGGVGWLACFICAVDRHLFAATLDAADSQLFFPSFFWALPNSARPSAGHRQATAGGLRVEPVTVCLRGPPARMACVTDR